MTATHSSSRIALRGAVAAMLVCMPFSAGTAFAVSMAHGNLQRLLACRTIAAAAARLKCFDAAAGALARTEANRRAAPRPPASSAEAGDGKASGGKAAALDPRRTFGLSAAVILHREVASGARRKAISHITERVTRLRQAPDGRMVYRLANGQVWEELDANGYAPPLKAGARVRISRGWLGSYWMQTASGRGCKVQRVR